VLGVDVSVWLTFGINRDRRSCWALPRRCRHSEMGGTILAEAFVVTVVARHGPDYGAGSRGRWSGGQHDIVVRAGNGESVDLALMAAVRSRPQGFFGRLG
jgi:branched-chain amino acid transport system permease protein